MPPARRASRRHPFLTDGSALVTARAVRLLPAAALPLVDHGNRHGLRHRCRQARLRRTGLQRVQSRDGGLRAGAGLVPRRHDALWPAPDIGDLDYVRPDMAATLQYCLTGTLPDGLTVDAIARATTLDSAKEGLALMRTMDEIRANPVFGDFGGAGWEWIGNFIAMGGFALLLLGVIRWHTPAGVLGGLLAMATLGWLLDPNIHPSPGFHLFSGGALLGAFFIATDPVSSPTTARGPADLRRRHRRADLRHPDLRQLPGRRRLRGAAHEPGGAADRPLDPAAGLRAARMSRAPAAGQPRAPAARAGRRRAAPARGGAPRGRHLALHAPGHRRQRRPQYAGRRSPPCCPRASTTTPRSRTSCSWTRAAASRVPVYRARRNGVPMAAVLTDRGA